MNGIRRNVRQGFLRFLLVSEVPDLYVKLREASRKNFRYVSSKSELVVPSYDKKQKCVFSFPVFLMFSPLIEGFGDFRLQIRKVST